MSDYDGDTIEGGNGAGVVASATAQSDTPNEVPAERKALVQSILKEIAADKKHWEPAFKRMRICMKLAANGTLDKETAEAVDGSYVVPIINRLIGVAVATLYAKNPKAVAKRKKKLMYKLWDGSPETLQAALQSIMPPQPAVGPDGQAMAPAAPAEVDPNAVALLSEVAQVKAEFIQYDRMAETMELLFSYFLQEQDSGYKEMFKALVRRVKVCAVGYVDLGYQRQLAPNPDVAAQIADVTSMIAEIEAGVYQLEEGDIEPATAKAERLRLMLEDLQQRAEMIVREGPTLSFPRATEVIPDRRCRHLKTFAGCRWVTREYDMTPEEILKTWKVDVGKNFTAYKSALQADGALNTTKEVPTEDSCAKVYCVQNKRDQQYYVVCDGYPDFIVAPKEPDVRIERFWTIFPLVFNEVEAENDDGSVSIFPPSDVWNARHMQREYNQARQGLREHRIAAKPGWVSPRGKLDDKDKEKLGARQGFEVVELNSLAAGETVDKLLMAIPVPGVDPGMYETETIFTDVQRSVGVQAANLGGTSGDTATESSIAEHSRDVANASDIDDLDTMLSALSRAMGQLMLTELSKETVIEIAGPGAVWPDLPPSREAIVKDLILEVEAGSSGRPNNAAVLANYERAMPWLTMIPGVNPAPIAKKGLKALDIDADDAFVEGAPSIAAINQMAGRNQQAGAGPNAPTNQGDQGGNNAKGPDQPNEPGPQPEYTAPQAS
jgi:hypothetical protein